MNRTSNVQFARSSASPVGEEGAQVSGRSLARILLISIFLLQAAFFRYVALHRFIDGDEGYYLMASRLILLHKTPYLDFFYMQAPLLPYAYALWMKVAGVSWVAVKLFAALLTALLSTLVTEEVYHQTRSWVAGLSAVVLFGCSTMIFAWFPVVKTYSLAGLSLFAAYVLITRISLASPLWLPGLSGLCFGLSVDTRSYLLLLAPLFVWWILHHADLTFKGRAVLWFLGGLLVGNLPAIFLFFSSPDLFLFNNLGYHAIRAHGGLVGMWEEKLGMVAWSLLGQAGNNGIQASLLLLISFAFATATRRRGYAPSFAFHMAIGIAFISILPTPAYSQYFSLCMPFLLVSSICLVDDLFLAFQSRPQRLVAAIACCLVLGLYVAASVPDFYNYLVTGDAVGGPHSAPDRGDWKLWRQIEVSDALDQIVKPGEVVASFFPGDIFQSKAVPLPGLENDSGLPLGDRLTAGQRKKYHVLSPAEMEAALARHEVRVVVLRNQYIGVFTREDLVSMTQMLERLRGVLPADGYTLRRSIGGVSIYVCCSQN